MLEHDRRRVPWVRFAVVLALVALDLWSKQAVFAWIGDGADARALLTQDYCLHWRYPLIGDWLALMTTENPGMAFGRFGDWPRVLVFGRIAAVLFLTVALWRSRRVHRLVLAGLVLVLAGAVGNLWDNLFRARVEGRPFGKVRDFIDVYFARWDWHFPTFNVADSCITIGAACFLLHSLFVHDEPEASDEPAAARVASS
jgi:signal peptidase II